MKQEVFPRLRFPTFNPDFLVEANFAYPVSFNGKMRFSAELPTSMSAQEVQAAVMAMPETEKWLEGKEPKKVIVVPDENSEYGGLTNILETGGKSASPP